MNSIHATFKWASSLGPVSGHLRVNEVFISDVQFQVFLPVPTCILEHVGSGQIPRPYNIATDKRDGQIPVPDNPKNGINDLNPMSL